MSRTGSAEGDEGLEAYSELHPITCRRWRLAERRTSGGDDNFHFLVTNQHTWLSTAAPPRRDPRHDGVTDPNTHKGRAGITDRALDGERGGLQDDWVVRVRIAVLLGATARSLNRRKIKRQPLAHRDLSDASVWIADKHIAPRRPVGEVARRSGGRRRR